MSTKLVTRNIAKMRDDAPECDEAPEVPAGPLVNIAEFRFRCARAQALVDELHAEIVGCGRAVNASASLHESCAIIGLNIVGVQSQITSMRKAFEAQVELGLLSGLDA